MDAVAGRSALRNRAGRGLGAALSRTRFDAAVLDMDGVVTDTVPVHLAAWQEVLDAYLAQEGTAGGPLTREDYLRHIDGRPRDDGVAAFLGSRGVVLPWGAHGDGPEAKTVCGLANRKELAFRRAVALLGVRAFPSSVALVQALLRDGFGVGLVSASRNARDVLAAAGVGGLFPVVVDGRDAERLALPGKPSPATFLEAARQLGATPARTVLVEDAVAGVAAGRTGCFGLVVGVDRAGDGQLLLAHGAVIVVADLGELRLAP